MLFERRGVGHQAGKIEALRLLVGLVDTNGFANILQRLLVVAGISQTHGLVAENRSIMHSVFLQIFHGLQRLLAVLLRLHHVTGERVIKHKIVHCLRVGHAAFGEYLHCLLTQLNSMSPVTGGITSGIVTGKVT